ncbi:hypothetical protein WDW37_04285 [Bdellovibrionota bacterium FG-1]
MKRILVVALGFLGVSSAWAGGESSGGGADDYRVVPAFFRAWYPEGQPVVACFQKVPDFGLEDGQLATIIRDAFKQWRDYIPLKRLNIVPSDETIRSNLDVRPVCQGDEDLTFYFGVENDEVKRYQTQYSRPFGFAQLTQEGGQYVNPPRKAKGIVWIAPPGFIDPQRGIPKWSSATADALAGLVLHEVGHVFGNGHVDGTVMTAKIGPYLENDSWPGASSRTVGLYSTIDSEIELVPCMECRLAYSAAETF